MVIPCWRCAHTAIASSLRELEALACSLATVLLALLHPAIAGEVAGVAQLLGHRARRILGRRGAVGRRCCRRGGGLEAEHVLERAGNALRACAGLAGNAAALALDCDIDAAAHLRDRQRS